MEAITSSKSLAAQRLLWGTFAVVSLVCLLCSSLCVFKNIQWYEIDLDIPGSMRPFSHNETERIAMRTIWSVQSFRVEMQYPVLLNKTIPISQLNNASIIGTLFNLPTASLFLLQDLQRTSLFFFHLSQIALGLSVVSFTLILGIYLRYCFSTQCRHSIDPYLTWYENNNGGGGGGICPPHSLSSSSTERPSAVTLYPNGTAIGTYVNESVWISQSRISLVILITSVVAFMTQLLGALFYAITLKLDSQSLLPSLARGLKILCMTHSPDACHIDLQWKIGILLFVSAAVIQFVQAIIIYLVAYEDRKIHIPISGTMSQPLIASM